MLVRLFQRAVNGIARATLAIAAIGFGCAAPAIARAAIVSPPLVVPTAAAKLAIGIVTIGDGVNSHGLFDTSNFQTGGETDPAKALATALQRGTHVTFLKGVYRFVAPFVSHDSGLLIEADPGARLIVANVQPVGLFDLMGDEVTLERLDVEVESAVPDQIVVRMKGKDAGVRFSRFEVTTDAADPSHPITVLKFEGSVRKSVIGNQWRPNAGVICLQSVDGNGLSFIGNEIGNGEDGGFPEGFAPRSCFRGLDLVRDEWCTITGNKFFGLGTPVNDKVESILRYQGDSSTEGGHLTVTGNAIEAIASDHMIWLRGCRWFNLTGNTIGPPTAFPDADGEAAICVVAEDGGAGGLQSGPGTICGNDIHNSAAEDTDGAALYLAGAGEVMIKANNFDSQKSRFTIRIDTGTCTLPSVGANRFTGWSGSPPLPISPILLAGATCDGIYVGANDYFGFSSTMTTGNPAGAKVFVTGLMDRSDLLPPDAQTQLSDLTTNCDLSP